ncbi:MAG: TonB-dependent receptor, partial [Oceanihabitans sp.]
MRKQKYIFVLILFPFFNTICIAQERDQDTLNTDVIQVVKPYTPTVSDAFKVKETPSLDDNTTNSKKKVNYNIFSFPVASTFTPAKGKAALLDKEKETKTYDNYATLGFGNYTNILGEVYLNHALNRTESVGAYLTHHSSQGGIKNLLLDDAFSNSKIQANYAKSERDLAWNIEAGFQHKKYNWYGIPQSVYNAASAKNIADVGHSYAALHLGGDLSLTDSYINSASVLFRRFGDNNKSSENR